MTVDTRLMTADELFAMTDDASKKYELVDGELIKMPGSGARSSNIALRIAMHLAEYVSRHQLGETYGADGAFVMKRNPDTVLIPDASFVKRERVVYVDEYFPSYPDLAIEVLSPTDRPREVKAKVRRYLEAGTSVVIVVDPRKQVATITTAAGSTDVTEEGALTAGVVPGWSLPMRELFR